MNKPPLIAHVIHRLDIGGLENGLVNLINNIPDDKYQHAIICMTEATEFSKRIKKTNVKIYELHKSEGQDFSIYRKMMKVFNEIHPDIVHSRNFGTIEAQFIAFLAGVKRRVHSEHGRDVSDLDGKNIKRVYIRRLLYLFSQACIPLSKNLEDWLLYDVKIPRKKVFQLYNGVDLARFSTNKEQTYIRDLPFNWDGRIIIGTVGRLQPVKNQEFLLLALAELFDKNPELKEKLGCIVVGDGVDKEKLKATTSKKNIENCVWFAGARNDVSEILDSLDIFILPSINEGISNTILEAMASSLPVIATRVGGNPELVDENNTGLLVPSNNPQAMADAILAYINDMTLAKKHGKAGRQRVEALFSLNKMVENYTKIYDKLICRVD